MENSFSNQLIKKLIMGGTVLGVVTIPVIFFFTRSLLYCIIFACGAIISIAGFFAMVKVTDRLLAKKNGKLLFFSVSFVKLSVIVAVSVMISKYSEVCFLYFIFGLSLIVIILMMEGLKQLYRSIKNGA